MGCRRFHRFDHSDVIGVEPGAHVLQVNGYHVDGVHNVGRNAALASRVEGFHRESGYFVDAAFHVLSGVGGSPESVFGRQQGHHVYAVFKHHVDGVLVAYGSGVVGKESHPLSLKHWLVKIGSSRSGM